MERKKAIFFTIEVVNKMVALLQVTKH